MNETLTERTYAGELCWQHIGLVLKTPALTEIGHRDGLPILSVSATSTIDNGKYTGVIEVETVGNGTVTLNPEQAIELLYY